MGYVYEDRLSDSPFVRTIWRTRSESNDCYTAFADGSWDIILIKRDAVTSVLLGGPMSRATPIPYVAGSEYLGIRFNIGTFMPHFSISQILNVTSVLPKISKTSFWLGRSAWEIPTYENVEAFVDKLVRYDLLLSDKVVTDALLRDLDCREWINPTPCNPDLVREQKQALSLRSVQRHFLKTTGLTQVYIRQIERASLAANLLQQGVPILSVAHEAGYADQAHMTRALKHLSGQTPAQIVHASKPGKF
jgi:Helix-turn-helix domain